MNESAEQESGGGSAQYEFTSEQNKVIGDLASAMQWVAALLLILGVLYGISAAVSLIQLFRHPASLFVVVYVGLIAVLFCALARWTREASAAFENVVSTQGRDVDHLMEALDNLRKKYSLLSVLVKIYVVLIIIGLILTIIALVTGALRP